MNITNDAVVAFHYDLSEPDSDFTETSRNGDPVLYLHGRRSILPGLEQALEGKAAGDHVEVEVLPERGYGKRDPQREIRVPMKHVNDGKSRHFNIGEIVQVNTPRGRATGRVIKCGRFNVDVDLNHPLAGKTLKFVIDIESVREATREELAHGHAHGAGGHQH